jgi:hypothetical protein
LPFFGQTGGTMSRVRIKEKIGVKGVASTRQVVTDALGNVLPWSVAQDSLARRGIRVPPELTTQNLVVNSGRLTLAQKLAGDTTAFIDRVQIGDCKVAGVVQKTLFPPDLSDTALVNEIRTLSGGPGGTFELDGHSFPDSVVKTEPAGLPGTLTAGVLSTFTDAGADFVADGITDRDVLTVYISGQDYILGIREVVSATELEVENPSSLSGAGLAYKVTAPGTQVLFSKLINGNNFPESQFGPLTTAHEAGLLYSNDALFNRVTFVPDDNDVGLILQPGTVDGNIINIQLDWLITF